MQTARAEVPHNGGLLGEAIERLERPLPKVAAMLERAEEDLLAFYAFPVDHWRKLRSTNPLERLNREIGRRTDVVGIFPDNASLIRLAGMLYIEQTTGSLGAATSQPSRPLSSSREETITPTRRKRRTTPSSKRPEQPHPSPTR
jgi:transposase-like protein